MRRYLAAIGVALLAWSCALIPQRVVLKPEVRVAPAEIGQQRPVAVTVLDERPRAVIGYRGGGPGMLTGEITTDQDVSSVIQQAIFEALKAKGFSPVTGSGPRTLKVEVRTLEYSHSSGLFVAIFRSEVALKGICLNSGRSYERLHRGEEQQQSPFVLTDDENERIINVALSRAVERLFGDPELLNCLAQ